jgi:hypothetical protein
MMAKSIIPDGRGEEAWAGTQLINTPLRRVAGGIGKIWITGKSFF